MKCMFRSTRGAAAVELAIILPVLLIIAFGIVEFGLLMYNKQVLTNASREGARAGIVQQTPRVSTDAITAVVQSYANSYLVGFPKGTPAVAVSAVCTKFADPLTVDVTYNYNFLVASKFIKAIPSPLTIGGHTVMKCE